MAADTGPIGEIRYYELFWLKQEKVKFILTKVFLK